MRKLIYLSLGFILIFSFSPRLEASEIDRLRKDMQQLRQDYESKITELEAKIETLTKKQAEEIAQITKKVETNLLDVEYVGRYNGPFQKGGLVVKNPFGFGNLSLGGYMDHEFENFDNSKSTFDQHRWIINIGAELHQRLKFYSEYEIEHGGPDASGGGKAKVEQAWIDYLINDAINFRLGALLVPFGRYNIYHDSDLQDLTDRPLVARDIIPTTWTESGAGFYGEFNPKIGSYEDLALSYELYAINGLDDTFSDTSLSGGKGSIESDNNDAKSVVGRVVLSPALGQEIGFSGYHGKYNSLDDKITGGAVDWLSTF